VIAYRQPITRGELETSAESIAAGCCRHCWSGIWWRSAPFEGDRSSPDLRDDRAFPGALRLSSLADLPRLEEWRTSGRPTTYVGRSKRRSRGALPPQMRAVTATAAGMATGPEPEKGPEVWREPVPARDPSARPPRSCLKQSSLRPSNSSRGAGRSANRIGGVGADQSISSPCRAWARVASARNWSAKEGSSQRRHRRLPQLEVDPDRDRVTCDGERLRPPRVLLYAMNAQAFGVVVTADDERGRATVYDLLPERLQGKVRAVGRLDQGSEGLLIFTK